MYPFRTTLSNKIVERNVVGQSVMRVSPTFLNRQLRSLVSLRNDGNYDDEELSSPRDADKACLSHHFILMQFELSPTRGWNGAECIRKLFL
jgi:hypothetical protein